MRIFLRIAAIFLAIAFLAGAVFYWNPLWVNDEHVAFRLWSSHVYSHSATAGVYRIHYIEAAPPDGSAGIPLLLIHGLGSRAEDWSAMIPSLASKGFHVYAPDLLGYGRSAKPGVVYSVALEEAAVTDFMHALGLQHADVDGWSMGGWIAAKIALDHPELVNRLVLTDSAGLYYLPTFSRDAFVPTDADGVRRLQDLLSPHPVALPNFVMRATLRRIATEGRIIQQSMDTMESGTDLLDARLKNIREPTLIVWGTEDKLIPIAVGEEMHRDIPNSVLDRIVGCGHLAPAECAKPVLAGTIQFLKSQPQLPPGEQSLR